MSTDTSRVVITPTTPYKPSSILDLLVDGTTKLAEDLNAKKAEEDKKKPIFNSDPNQIKDAQPETQITGKKTTKSNILTKDAKGDISVNGNPSEDARKAQEAAKKFEALKALAPELGIEVTASDNYATLLAKITAKTEAGNNQNQSGNISQPNNQNQNNQNQSQSDQVIVEQVYGNNFSANSNAENAEGNNSGANGVEEEDGVSGNNNFGKLTLANSNLSWDMIYAPTADFPPINPLSSITPVDVSQEQNQTGNSENVETEYDISLQQLNARLKNEKISFEEYKQEKKKLIAAAKTDAEEQVDSISSDKQKATIDNFINSNNNKTFSKIDFTEDPATPGAVVAKQELPEVGLIKTVKVLKDGTKIEISENDKRKGFWAGVWGKTQGLTQKIVGGAEMVAGVAVDAGLGWTVIGGVIGTAMVVDGGRRLLCCSDDTKTVYTATITNPGYKPRTINSNYEGTFYDKLYKEIGLIDDGIEATPIGK